MRLPFIHLAAFLASILSFLPAQAQEEPEKQDKVVDLTLLPPISTKEGVTYETDIKPLFESSCFRCHGAEKQRGHLRLDSLESVMAGSEDGKILTVGDSAHSQLVISVARIDEESAMPPIRKPRKNGPAAPPAPEGSKPVETAAPSVPPANRPPPAKPLTPEEVGLVRAWIEQGAK